MTTNKPHPHAEVLLAIAAGVPLNEFEVQTIDIKTEYWGPINTDDHQWICSPYRWHVRRKPQYIMVNGFKVPKPLDVMPFSGLICSPDVTLTDFYVSGDVSYTWVKRCFERGIAHATREAAIAHAKAMLGIDPEYFK